jgi:hypothetical protein
MADKKRGNGGMTKREAVRLAMADMGPEARPAQLVGHIRSKFGIDMTVGHVAVERRKLLLKTGGGKRPAGRRPGRPSAGKTAARTTGLLTPANGTALTIDLEDIQAVKDLVERVGADSLRKLIDVLES